MHFKSILVPTDFSDASLESAKFVMRLCKQVNTNAHVLHSIDASPFAMYGDYTGWQEIRVTDEVRENADKELDKFIRKLGTDAPVSGKNVVTTDDVATSICEAAKTEGASLIAMSTHGRSGINRVLLGSVTEQVLRNAPCPVLTTRPKSIAGDGDIKSIVCTTDFSKPAMACAKLAVETAKTLGAKLTILHVIDEEQLALLHAHPMLSEYINKETLKEHTQASLDKFTKELGLDPKENAVLYSFKGHSGDGVVDYTDNNSTDMIIMSTHGYSGAKHLLLGSVTERVVRRASCPVLATR